jgi:hypothetical protein
VGKKGSLNAKSAFIFAGFLPLKGLKNLINFSQGKTQAILTKDLKVRKLSTAPQRSRSLNDAAPGLWITSIFQKASKDLKSTHSIGRRPLFQKA